MAEPLRVLCLDIEGGHGGSSRSLFHMLRSMDRSQVEPEVWCRRSGPIQSAYAELGVPCRVMPDMPKVSSLPRLSRNLYVYARAWPAFLRSRAFRRQLLSRANGIDVVHFNHEALFLLARWLRPRTRAALTMHIRTNLWDTCFARWQTRIESTATDHLVFITANEERTHRALGGHGAGRVIHNVVEVPDALPEPWPGLEDAGRFRVASLSNCSWGRGTDRLLEVAGELRAMGREDVVFVMAGDMRLSRTMPGVLGGAARSGGGLAEAADGLGLSAWFRFLGHMDAPERVLAACHVLAKPTREDNPWGRDILEAMAHGLPVLSVGSDTTFVETGVTGLLQGVFDARALAAELARLADDRAACAALGRAARERVARLCNGPARAADLLDLWREATRERRARG